MQCFSTFLKDKDSSLLKLYCERNFLLYIMFHIKVSI
uniref:Uncharacterized protein n=1 Tax=Anguilla anguilla TaxID=7936 RepID=A0A0E9SZH4_ANGAN